MNVLYNRLHKEDDKNNKEKDNKKQKGVTVIYEDLQQTASQHIIALALSPVCSGPPIPPHTPPRPGVRLSQYDTEI